MPDRFFVGDGTFTNWNTTNNWSTSSGGASGSSVPGISDVVYFDNGGVGNCTLDINVSVIDFYINVAGAYTGTLGFNGYDLTISGTTNGLVFNSTGSPTIDFGNGNHTIGRFDTNNTDASNIDWGPATWSISNYFRYYSNFPGTWFGTITVTGNTSFVTRSGDNFMTNITVNNGITLTHTYEGGVNTWYAYGIITANGIITTTGQIKPRQIIVASTGQITGSGNMYFTYSGVPVPGFSQQDGYVNLAYIQATLSGFDATFAAGDYGNTEFKIGAIGGSGSWTWGSGTVKCKKLDIGGSVSGNTTVRNDTNNPDFEIVEGIDNTSGFSVVYYNGTGTITMNGASGTHNILWAGGVAPGDIEYEDVVIDASGATKQIKAGWNFYCKSLTVSAGTFDANDRNVTASDDIVLSTSGEVSMGTGTWTCGGSWLSSTIGTLITTGNTLILTGTSKLLDGESFNDVNVSGSYILQSSDLSINDLNVTGGFSNVNNLNINVAGNFTIAAGATWTKGTGTIAFDGTGDHDIDTKGFSLEATTVNKTSSIRLTSAFTAVSLTINTGTFDPNGQTITTTGDVDINSPAIITASGLAGSTWTVGGNYTADGISGTPITLNPSSAWTLNITGTASANYVTVAYSNASGGSEVVAIESTDSNNNSNWLFQNATDRDTQVYVTGVLYLSDAFPDDPHTVFDYVDENFREISGLEFEYLSINRTEARFSGGSTREQLLIFMKDVIYNDNKYLSDTNSGNLRTALINKLNTMTDISYTDVEIRSTRETT